MSNKKNLKGDHYLTSSFFCSSQVFEGNCLMFIQKMKPFIEAVLVGKKVIVSISQIKNMEKGVGLTLGENFGLKDGYHRKKGY